VAHDHSAQAENCASVRPRDFSAPINLALPSAVNLMLWTLCHDDGRTLEDRRITDVELNAQTSPRVAARSLCFRIFRCVAVLSW